MCFSSSSLHEKYRYQVSFLMDPVSGALDETLQDSEHPATLFD